MNVIKPLNACSHRRLSMFLNGFLIMAQKRNHSIWSCHWFFIPDIWHQAAYFFYVASPPNYNILSQFSKMKNPCANGGGTLLNFQAIKYMYLYGYWFLPWVTYLISELIVCYKTRITAHRLHFYYQMSICL